jgi:hypothetical protein
VETEAYLGPDVHIYKVLFLSQEKACGKICTALKRNLPVDQVLTHLTHNIKSIRLDDGWQMLHLFKIL